MNIHEYQAKAILRSYGVPVPTGIVAESPDDARRAARELGGELFVIKAQIHAGGRGKGRYVGEPACSGVQLVRTPEETSTAAQDMLDRALVTKQTGPQGRVVRKLYIEAACDIAHEYYLSMLVDRTARRIVVIASSAGGMNIEDVACETPELIHTVRIDPVLGLMDYQSRELAVQLGLREKQINAFALLLRAIYTVFIEKDASLIEINPLVTTVDGSLRVVDTKMAFDDNGLFRHSDILELRDPNEEDPREQEAARHGLSYVGMDGTIGCMVNGAGLAMATMDIIHEEGESPANFLDVGGGASREKVSAAFRILLEDPHIEGVLVNIFGGIMRCDVIAEAVIAACRDVGLSVPLVVRLAGTKVEEGTALILQSGLDVTPASDLGDAARKIVAAVRARRHA